MKPILLLRLGLPGAITIAGIVVIIVGTSDISNAFGIVLIAIAALVVLVNWLARLTVSSQDDREAEQRARVARVRRTRIERRNSVYRNRGPHPRH